MEPLRLMDMDRNPNVVTSRTAARLRRRAAVARAAEARFSRHLPLVPDGQACRERNICDWPMENSRARAGRIRWWWTCRSGWTLVTTGRDGCWPRLVCTKANRRRIVARVGVYRSRGLRRPHEPLYRRGLVVRGLPERRRGCGGIGEGSGRQPGAHAAA